MKLDFSGILFLIAVIATPLSSCADVIVHEFDFNTDGDNQGLIDFADRLPTDAVAGGVFSGTAGSNNDPQLRTQQGILSLDIGSLTDATLEIRAKNSTGGAISGAISFISFVGAGAANQAGVPVPAAQGFSFVPAAADTFQVFTIDAKALLAGVVGDGVTTNDGIVRSLRLDPVNNAGSGISGDTFEIDYIRITTAVPEPSTAAILGLSSLGLGFRRRKA